MMRELLRLLREWPARLVLRIHAPVDLGEGIPFCVRHGGSPIEWPCQDVRLAADSIEKR